MKRIAALTLVAWLGSIGAAHGTEAFIAVKPTCRTRHATLISPAGAGRTIALEGTGHTNILDSGTTLGSAEIEAGGRTLHCGILGQLQTTNPDGTLAFQHTLSCEDHSLFLLHTHTTIEAQSACPTRSGSVGVFEETSVIEGMDGPFAGWTGEDAIAGTIDCGFVDFTFTASLTRP